jgi:hypothetical protein
MLSPVVAATPSRQKPLTPLSLVVALSILALALTAPAVHAQSPKGPYTLYSSTIAYTTTSGYTPENVNFTWTNTNTCGSFAGEYPPSGPNAGDAPTADWDYGPGVGASPCASSLPSGTITETIASGGVVLASCTDNQGAATFGNPLGENPSYCTTAGTGVTIEYFSAQAYDAAGNPISAGSSGNDDWVIAVVVVIILILLLLFFFLSRKRKAEPRTAGPQGLAGGAEAEARKVATEAGKEGKVAVDKVKAALNRATRPAAAGGQASPASPPSSAPAGGKSHCANCGSPLDPGASFCRSCGAKVS